MYSYTFVAFLVGNITATTWVEFKGKGLGASVAVYLAEPLLASRYIHVFQKIGCGTALQVAFAAAEACRSHTP